MQIMTLKATTWGAFWVDVIWNFGIFPQFKYQIVSYARDFPPVKFFFLNCYFKNSYFQLPQNVPWTDEITRVITANTGVNGLSLARHIS